MKAKLFESVYCVELDRDDVVEWAERWPCYGARHPLAFQFSRANGDLIDVKGAESESGAAAICNDACVAGALALGLPGVLALRSCYGDAEAVAAMLASQ